MTRQEKINEAVKKLEEGVQEVMNSEKYKEYLKAMSKFQDYSFANVMMILFQKPEATQVAGFKTWQNDFNRNVKKGEKGIQIFVPYFHKKEVENEEGEMEEKQYVTFGIGHVFDVSQTEGEEVPSIVKKLEGDVKEYNELLKKLEAISPVNVRYEKINGSANGCYSETKNEIVIDKNMSEQQTIKTLVHEITHAKLHGSGDGIDRNTKEVQAESVAYVVNNYLGIDTSEYSFGYVGGWSKDKEFSELKESLDVIQKTAKEIINELEK